MKRSIYDLLRKVIDDHNSDFLATPIENRDTLYITMCNLKCLCFSFHKHGDSCRYSTFADCFIKVYDAFDYYDYFTIAYTPTVEEFFSWENEETLEK